MGSRFASSMAALLFCAYGLVTLAGCGGGTAATTTTVSTPVNASSGCALAANTQASGTVTSGCALLTRGTSSCQSARASQGLSGAWLKFSCRVGLQVVTIGGQRFVQLSADSQPDYTSNYFPPANSCFASFTPALRDPNTISSQSMTALIPLAPNTTRQTMGLGTVGFAVNGVALFNNQAAPGDDIYLESDSFDQCQGHPQQSGVYHYHSEPYSISSNDANLIGVLRDGYFVYGRKDANGALPQLDAAGGHTGTTPDSPGTPVYHYHLSLQTSTTAGSAGRSVWFITTGSYAGSPGTCNGC